MNIPFSPAFLWPIPVALVVGGIVFERRRRKRQATRVEPPPSEGANPPPGVRRWEWAVSVCLIWLGVTWSWSLLKFAVPPIQGRVVDRDTGAPIGGVLFMRDLSRAALLGFIAMSGSGEELAAPTVSVRSDRQGKFRIPGWVAVVPMGVWGLSDLSWVAYAEDHIPILFEAPSPGFHPFLFHNFPHQGLPATGFPFEWVAASWLSNWQPVRVEVTMKRKVTPSDFSAWFSQTVGLVQRQMLPVDELVKQSVKFVEGGGEITPSVSAAISSIVNHLDFDSARRIEAACAPGRTKPCLAEFRTRILSQRLVREVARDFDSGDVEKGFRCLDAGGEVTQAMREDVLPKAYYDAFWLHPQTWRPARRVLVHERDRCARTTGLCGTRYSDWLEREFKHIENLRALTRAERAMELETTPLQKARPD